MTESLQNYKECSFYRAKLCYRGTSYDSVSGSVTSRNSIETVKGIELVFGMEAFFHLYLYAVTKKFGYLKCNGSLLPSGALCRHRLNELCRLR